MAMTCETDLANVLARHTNPSSFEPPAMETTIRDVTKAGLYFTSALKGTALWQVVREVQIAKLETRFAPYTVIRPGRRA